MFKGVSQVCGDDDGSFGSDEFGSAVDVSWSLMRAVSLLAVAGEGCGSAQVW